MTSGNPCCIPLTLGVKIITHLSMALAVALGVMGVRLISISLEVASNPPPQKHLTPESLLYINPTGSFKSDSASAGIIEGSSGIYTEYEWNDSLLIFSQNHNIQSDSQVSRDFALKYSKVVLVCGVMALCSTIFQFLCSYLFFCFINWEAKAPSQIWVAVNCSILFCFATSLVLFLCESTSLPAYSTDEKLFLLLLTADTLLSIYFMWMVVAFI